MLGIEPGPVGREAQTPLGHAATNSSFLCYNKWIRFETKRIYLILYGLTLNFENVLS